MPMRNVQRKHFKCVPMGRCVDVSYNLFYVLLNAGYIVSVQITTLNFLVLLTLVYISRGVTNMCSSRGYTNRVTRAIKVPNAACKERGASIKEKKLFHRWKKRHFHFWSMYMYTVCITPAIEVSHAACIDEFRSKSSFWSISQQLKRTFSYFLTTSISAVNSSGHPQ